MSRMTLYRIAALLLTCIGLCLSAASQDIMAEIAKSHIEANVPKGKLFDEYLQRDLKDYFCKASKDCKVDYELLRDGPTQTGISYPKYYLWVKCADKGSVIAEGAVRVAAMEQKSFDITDFLSQEQISESPSQVARVFPAALVDKIVRRARQK